MYEPKPCVECKATCKFCSSCPRLGLGFYLCPVCDERQYIITWPPLEYNLIETRLMNDISQAKYAMQTFLEEYRGNPKKALEKYKK